MRRPLKLSAGQLMGAAIVLGAAGVFFLDMFTTHGTSRVVYCVIVAAAGWFGRRAVIVSAALAAVLMILPPVLGAESGLTLLQMMFRYLVGLVGIGVVTWIVLHLLNVSAESSAREEETKSHDEALVDIARQALIPDVPLQERFQRLTEMTAKALEADGAAVTRRIESGQCVKAYDLWYRHVARHVVVERSPVSETPEFRKAMERDGVVAADDVQTSALHRDAAAQLAHYKMRAILHADAMHRERAIGSLIVFHSLPHHWTPQEIIFAKYVSQIVALQFAVHEWGTTLAHLDLISEGIFVESKGGTVVYANRRARELAGSPEVECAAIPLSLVPLMKDSDQHQIRFNGHDLEIQRSRLPDGEVITRVDDVTARNAAIAEGKRMEAGLEHSARLQAMGQLAASVAHDFNNILMAANGFADLLARAVQSRPAERALAERIISVCAKGKNLAAEVLAFARTSSAEKSVVDLALLLTGPGGVMAGETAGSAQLSVAAPQQSLPIFGNASQIKQVIHNLVANARRACEGIDGRIAISCGRTTQEEVQRLAALSGKPHERIVGEPNIAKEYCFIRVADNGRGIPPEMMDRIFEPFFASKGRPTSSGLVLVVVQGSIEAHGGFCHVQSQPDVGTVITIYVPLLAEAALIPSQATENVGAPPLQSPRGPEKILIVDDDVDCAESLSMCLQQFGYVTAVVHDPQEALGIVRQTPSAFDVLVTDEMMENVRGLELIAAIRQFNKDMRTILCTGAEITDIEANAKAAGADAVLQKPIGAASVAACIRSLCPSPSAQAA